MNLIKYILVSFFTATIVFVLGMIVALHFFIRVGML